VDQVFFDPVNQQEGQGREIEDLTRHDLDKRTQ